MKDFKRVLADAVADDFQGVVHDALGDALLAVAHDAVDDHLDLDAVVARVGADGMSFGASAARHVTWAFGERRPRGAAE